MYKIDFVFEPIILEALKAWETDHEDIQVAWTASIDFLPDVAEDGQEGLKLVPAMGIYLEIPGPTPDTVATNSFYYTPFLVDAEKLKEVVTAALDSMLAKRQEAEVEAEKSLKSGL